MSPPVRVAVIGAGAIAQVVHLPILSRMRGVEVAALYDANPETARTIAGRFGVADVPASPEAVWEDGAIDAVVVCSPSDRHEAQVLGALAAGKWVLCEKPLALRAEGVRRVLAEPGAVGRLMVGMNQRFRPDAAALRQFVTGGELGDVYYLKAGWLNRRNARPRVRTWRERRETAGGGAFMDLGVQMLDLALWVLDNPTPRRVSAMLHVAPGDEVEDAAVAMLRLDDGRVVNLEVSWNLRAARDRQFLHLLGSQGSASLSPLAVHKDLPSGLADVTPRVPPGRENLYTASYRAELQHFVEAIRGERELEAPEEHVTLMRVIEAAYRSAGEGREVEVGD